jgi:hypothetical protein
VETEHLEKRFGITAVEKGFITPEQLLEAMRIQVMEDMEQGHHRIIGRILLEQGRITNGQIQAVLETLGKSLPILKEEKMR